MKMMDLDSFLEEMDNDYESVNMIVNEFIKSLDSQMLNITTLLTEKKYKVIAREAHSIKGGAKNLMAPNLEKSAQLLEESAKSQDSASTVTNVYQLKKDVEEFKQYIGEHMPMPIAAYLS